MDNESLINLIYIIPLLIAIIYFYIRQSRKKTTLEKSERVTIVQRDGDHFVESLTVMGYFRFASPDQLEALIEEVRICYQTHGVLGTLEENWMPLCHRLFSADAEFVFEEGGIIQTLKVLKPAFEIRGLKLEINDHFEDYSENIANQWVVINERKYVIYDALKASDAEWKIAIERLLDLLNSEFELQGSDERVYQISEGNDSQLVILTSPMFDFLISSDIESEWKPARYSPAE
ncbi:MAG: hypothetical protein AAFQ94_02405 [Bacteroidota bacterium]